MKRPERILVVRSASNGEFWRDPDHVRAGAVEGLAGFLGEYAPYSEARENAVRELVSRANAVDIQWRYSSVCAERPAAFDALEGLHEALAKLAAIEEADSNA